MAESWREGEGREIGVKGESVCERGENGESGGVRGESGEWKRGVRGESRKLVGEGRE